jgi:hypothetical protein
MVFCNRPQHFTIHLAQPSPICQMAASSMGDMSFLSLMPSPKRYEKQLKKNIVSKLICSSSNSTTPSRIRLFAVSGAPKPRRAITQGLSETWKVIHICMTIITMFRNREKCMAKICLLIGPFSCIS